MSDDFGGRIVLITGGARGQGEAETRVLHAAGATVLVADILDDLGQALVKELGGKSAYIHLDVTSQEDWAGAVQRADAMGGLFGLINNAGVYTPATVAETDRALWDRHVNVNQLGAYLGIKEAAPAMARHGKGSIVNIASVAATRGSNNAFAYCATKWAVRGMSRCAARELAASKIRVNCILPGMIDTEMLSTWSAEDHITRVAPIPMARKGTAGEIAEVAAFLLSDRASYMTGSEIAVDGGLTA